MNDEGWEGQGAANKDDAVQEIEEELRRRRQACQRRDAVVRMRGLFLFLFYYLILLLIWCTISLYAKILL